MSQEPPPIPSFPQTPKESPRPRGTSMPPFVIALIVVGAIGLVLLLLFAAIMLPALARAREAARRSSCAGNLKQVGLICKMYSSEAPNGFYPQLSPDAGQLMYLGKEVFPEYLTDGKVLVCPSDSENQSDSATSDPLSAVNDNSYIYLGYVITSDDEMEAFAKVYKERVAQGLPFDTDLEAPPGRGSGGTDTFYRLRQGIERLLAKDVGNPAPTAMMQSIIPIMWDKVSAGNHNSMYFNHIPGGANVLFMDGHVEYVRYPSEWPLTKRTAEIIAELDALGP